MCCLCSGFCEETPVPGWQGRGGKTGCVPRAIASDMCRYCRFFFPLNQSPGTLVLPFGTAWLVSLGANDVLSDDIVLDVQKNLVTALSLRILRKCCPDFPLPDLIQTPVALGTLIPLYSCPHLGPREVPGKWLPQRGRLTGMGTVWLLHPQLSCCFAPAHGFVEVPLLLPSGVSAPPDLLTVGAGSFTCKMGERELASL